MNKNRFFNLVIGASLVVLIATALVVFLPLNLIPSNPLSIPGTGSHIDIHTYAGTGDPARFRAWPWTEHSVERGDGYTYAGTGDPVSSRAGAINQDAASMSVPVSGTRPQGPTTQNCFSPSYHAASDCDWLASDR